MIFVTIGTQPQSFQRLFDELDKLVSNGVIKEEIIAQIGVNEVKNPRIKTFKFLPACEMQKYLQQSRLVISHGGTGSIITALKLRKKVIGIPRLAKFGEHVNDHQVDLVDALAENAFIIPLYDIKDLADKIVESEQFTPKEFTSAQASLVADLKTYIENI